MLCSFRKTQHFSFPTALSGSASRQGGHFARGWVVPADVPPLSWGRGPGTPPWDEGGAWGAPHLGAAWGRAGSLRCPAGKPLEGDNRQCTDCAAPHAPSGCLHPACSLPGHVHPLSRPCIPLPGTCAPARTCASPPWSMCMPPGMHVSPPWDICIPPGLKHPPMGHVHPTSGTSASVQDMSIPPGRVHPTPGTSASPLGHVHPAPGTNASPP